MSKDSVTTNLKIPILAVLYIVCGLLSLWHADVDYKRFHDDGLRNRMYIVSLTGPLALTEAVTDEIVWRIEQ